MTFNSSVHTNSLQPCFFIFYMMLYCAKEKLFSLHVINRKYSKFPHQTTVMPNNLHRRSVVRQHAQVRVTRPLTLSFRHQTTYSGHLLILTQQETDFILLPSFSRVFLFLHVLCQQSHYLSLAFVPVQVSEH